jgi:hypothetical protein
VIPATTTASSRRRLRCCCRVLVDLACHAMAAPHGRRLHCNDRVMCICETARWLLATDMRELSDGSGRHVTATRRMQIEWPVRGAGGCCVAPGARTYARWCDERPRVQAASARVCNDENNRQKGHWRVTTGPRCCSSHRLLIRHELTTSSSCRALFSSLLYLLVPFHIFSGGWIRSHPRSN